MPFTVKENGITPNAENSSGIIKEIGILVEKGASFEEVAALVDTLPEPDQKTIGSVVAFIFANKAAPQPPAAT